MLVFQHLQMVSSTEGHFGFHPKTQNFVKQLGEKGEKGKGGRGNGWGGGG